MMTNNPTQAPYPSLKSKVVHGNSSRSSHLRMEANDYFGSAAVVAHNTVLVGARLDDEWEPNAGSAYF